MADSRGVILGSQDRLSASQALTGEAFRDLYPALRRFAAVVADADMEADELIQEAVTSLLRQPAGHVRDLHAYLRQSILYAVSRHRRQAARARAATTRATAGSAAARSSEYPSDVRVILASVKPVDRALLYLVDVEGVAIAEAAEMLGITAVAARARAVRARRTARAALKGDSS